MPINPLDFFEHIETRISDLQKAHVCLQEQHKNSENNKEHHLDQSALSIIDILDMIDLSKAHLDDPNNTMTRLIINKIEKRLKNILATWHVQEITFKDNQIEQGKARVIETRKISENIPHGTIIDICRKGYQRADRTIRPADVITAEVLLP